MRIPCSLCKAAPGVVETPVGEGSARMCWPCAHAAVEHDGEPCSCPPDAVHPADARREEERLATVGAFDAAVRPCLAFLRLVALRLTRNTADADDVLQDALIRAMLAWPTFEQRSEAKTSAWLSVILKRCFVDQWRRRKHDPVELHAEAAADDPVAWTAYLDAQRAIAALGPDQRVVLELAMVGTTYEEIAEQLAIPVGTVKSQLHRARRNVEAFL